MSQSPSEHDQLRHLVEVEMPALEARLAHAEAALAFTAKVAHDFNNLLTVISGYADLGTNADERHAHGYFRQIASAAQKAVALTRDLAARAALEPL